MNIVLRIQRFNPHKNQAPVFVDYTIDMQPTERILDALLYVKRRMDGSLGFRRSCGHGVCGSDAMIINGKERLACKTLVRDVAAGTPAAVDSASGTPTAVSTVAEKSKIAVGPIVYVEPLRHLPVERDLMVDQNAFFKKYRTVKPYFINEEPVKEGERIQSQQERNLFEEPTSCILCAACYSACPVLDEVLIEKSDFIGPAAIIQAARFLLDSRDKGFDERKDILNAPSGVWPCRNHFECTRVCPRRIKITKTINIAKQKIKKSSGVSA